MKVFALIGGSGTGKSYRALMTAHKYDIPLIVDDGLLIQGTSLLSGKSAKREVTRIAAVKRAIFDDSQHAKEVKEQIFSSNHKKILILATSVKMAEKISQTLQLPSPQKIIDIKEIASTKAISKALHLRRSKNQHVIPIPTFEIKKDFPGYLMDPLKFLLRNPATPHGWGERSVMRPAYSSVGSFYIATQVLTQLVEHKGEQNRNIHKVLKVTFTPLPEGLNVSLIVTLKWIEQPLISLLRKMQQEIKEELETLTGFTVFTVNITAKKIHISPTNDFE